MSILDAFPRLWGPFLKYDEEWRRHGTDGDGPGIYNVSAELLCPLVVRPLLSSTTPDELELQKLCDLAESLLQSGDVVAATFVRIDLGPEFRAARNADLLLDKIGPLTRVSCEIG